MLRILDVLSGRSLAGVRLEGTGISASPSDASGRLEIQTAADDDVTVSFRGDAVVTRQARLRVSGVEPDVALIPASFDLTAFDQMARQPAIKRWTTVPALAIEQRVLRFDDLERTTWTTTSVAQASAEVDGLVQDLTSGLNDLTGGKLTAFSAVTREMAAAGSTLTLGASDRITVYWVEGLARASGYDGFARWQYRNYAITGGIILLDTQSDLGANRRWLRIHELGHTLGLSHVTTRASLMAPSAQPMTAFDREAGKLVYARQPGNRTPDIDPSEASLNSTAPARWSAWIR